MEKRRTLKVRLEEDCKATEDMVRFLWNQLREVSNERTTDDIIDIKLNLQYWRGRNITSYIVK